ncbi:MAG: hypothetical protein ACTSSG_09355 [Candidatus Heimdallarchaeaceae archaeon]
MSFDKIGEKISEQIEEELKKKKNKSKDDPEEIKEILKVVSTEVPALIKNIFSAIYDPEIAGNYGKGIGALYKQLKDQGLPEDMIKDIIRDFAKSFNVLGTVLKDGVDVGNLTKKEKEIKIEKKDDDED